MACIRGGGGWKEWEVVGWVGGGSGGGWEGGGWEAEGSYTFH